MSKYHRTATQYKDRDCLVGALNDMGYDVVEVNEVPQPLFDYTGKPTRYVDATGDKANVIVRRKYIGGMPNDLGFIFNAATKTYDAIVSEYDQGKHDKTWFGHLTAKYSERRIQKSVKSLGFSNLVKPVRKNGKLILEVGR